MDSLRLVLCPVDFSDVSRQELGLAVEVCQAFNARLLVHHNMNSVPPGLTRNWEWNEVNQRGYVGERESEQRLRELLSTLPRGLPVQASVSHGPPAPVLTEMARTLPADLLVLGSHGLSDSDHASLTERIIDASPCPVLTLHPGVRLDRFHLRDTDGEPTPVLVLADLSSQTPAVIAYAWALARAAPVHLHLTHVLPAGSEPTVVRAVGERLAALIPEDLRSRCTCHVECGDAVETALQLVDDLQAGFILMGEHARGFLLRLFIKDTALALLHRASCPVWYVPGAYN